MSELHIVRNEIVDEQFQEIIETNGLAAEEVRAEFEDSLDELDKMSPDREEKLREQKFGKVNGVQDLGGGGFEWSK